MYILSIVDQLRLLVIVLSTLILPILFIKKKYFSVFTIVSIIALLTYPLRIYYTKYNTSQYLEKSAGSTLRIIQQNCWSQNRDFSQLSTELQQRNPDIIFLQECSLNLFEQICHSSLASQYDMFVQFEFSDGIRFDNRLIIFTRGFNLIKEDDHRTLSLSQIFLQEKAVRKRTLSLMNIHLDRPYRIKFDYYKQFINLVNKPGGAMILAGDFNLVPWSKPVHFILKELSLYDTRQGSGLHPTYPARLPYSSLNVQLLPILPIDHIFVSPDFIVRSFKTLPFIGSDHLGIQVDVEWS